MSEHFATISQRFLTRRSALRLAGLAGVSAALGAFGKVVTRQPGFASLVPGRTGTHHVADGYRANVLIGWGDGLDGSKTASFPLDSARQEAVFGYNNDFIAYTPLAGSHRGILGINHEYPLGHLMFPGYGSHDDARQQLSLKQVRVEMASVGHSVIEVRRGDEGWHVVPNSKYARRIHANTPMTVDGPAAGHALLRTTQDPAGQNIAGTLGCCSGGTTPWGTVLIAEENVGDFFRPATTRQQVFNELAHNDTSDVFVRWADQDRRFDMAREPNELNRFGWIVEYDPLNPASVPVKHTALGRFEHEGATVAWAENKPVVVYCGDDTENEYVYRYVSNGVYQAGGDHSRLLVDGTLFCARFNDDGTGVWLPLRFGEGPLTEKSGFKDQGQVLIQTRRAAALLGATPMDRPEGIAINESGNVYVALTKNKNKGAAQPANPRRHNAAGHILEILPPREAAGARHWADDFRWDLLLQGGDPGASGDDKGVYGNGASLQGASQFWLTNPDNLAFDPSGRLWIATDGMEDFGYADGLWCTETEGPERGLPRQLFQCPRGAELCGPAFTPDGESLFVAVQHPADEDGSHYASPSTRWPDFNKDSPPRPAVVAITREGGGVIGA